MLGHLGKIRTFGDITNHKNWHSSFMKTSYFLCICGGHLPLNLDKEIAVYLLAGMIEGNPVE